MFLLECEAETKSTGICDQPGLSVHVEVSEHRSRGQTLLGGFEGFVVHLVPHEVVLDLEEWTERSHHVGDLLAAACELVDEAKE